MSDDRLRSTPNVDPGTGNSGNDHFDTEDEALLSALLKQPDYPVGTEPINEGPNEHAGTAEIKFAGTTLLADWTGTLFWPSERTLIVSDLHLEKGSSFARRGQPVPPYDTNATLKRLTACIERWQPLRVISLGDSFHDDEGAERLHPSQQLILSDLMKDREWVWIRGNHDPSAPANLGGIHAEELAIGEILFRHEPTPNCAVSEISGHLHPAAKIVRRGRRVRRFCFISDEKRIILPPFGAYTGGLNVLDRAFDGLFEGRQFETLMLGRERIYRIKGKGLSR